MVFGAKLRTIMSSIIRWRKGETLRAVAIELLKRCVVAHGKQRYPKTSPQHSAPGLSYADAAHCEKNFTSAAFPRSGLVVCWACSAVWR